MAEHVQAGLEGMLMELQQLQRVQLLSPDEVKSVIKKRKHFEYKLQKRSKQKEDILEYIQYESSLLHLIGMRRDKSKYGHKKDEIDYAIARRINKLFRILEHRFAGDLKIWSSHIAFLVKMDWKEMVGKVYRRMLQVHPEKINLWISAARFEMGSGGQSGERGDGGGCTGLSVENARTILMEAIRFHPKSVDLYLESLCLELIFVDSLTKDPSKHMVPEETLGLVKQGKVAETIFKKGLDDVTGGGDESESTETKFKFIKKSLQLAVDLGAPQPLIQAITKSLDDGFSDDPRSYQLKAIARLHPLNSNDHPRTQWQKLEECCQIYEEGLNGAAAMHLPVHKQRLLTAYVTTLCDVMDGRFSLGKKSSDLASQRLWHALQFGNKNKILNLQQEELLAALSKDMSQ